jgi:hypothetical protein
LLPNHPRQPSDAIRQPDHRTNLLNQGEGFGRLGRDVLTPRKVLEAEDKKGGLLMGRNTDSHTNIVDKEMAASRAPLHIGALRQFHAKRLPQLFLKSVTVMCLALTFQGCASTRNFFKWLNTPAPKDITEKDILDGELGKATKSSYILRLGPPTACAEVSLKKSKPTEKEEICDWVWNLGTTQRSSGTQTNAVFGSLWTTPQYSTVYSHTKTTRLHFLDEILVGYVLQ